MSITKLESGRYRVNVYMGKTRGRKTGTCDIRAEAKKLERRFEEERGRTTAGPAGREWTCEAWVDYWLANFPRPSGSTNRTYRYAVAAFKSDFVGVKLRSLDRLAVREWAIDQPKSNLRPLRAMLYDARDAGVLTENPFADLRFAQSRGRKDLVVITLKQLERLKECAIAEHGDYGYAFAAMIEFAAWTGMRPGEIFALERADVDFRRGEIHVRRNLDGAGVVQAYTKNGRQRRIVLPEVDSLRSALARMPERIDTPLMFVGKRGTMFRRPKLYDYWSPVRAAAGLSDMDFYELRHWCATQLLEMGVMPNDVAVQLGHTDGGKLVMETYGHPSDELARERVRAAFRPRVTDLADQRGRRAIDKLA